MNLFTGNTPVEKIIFKNAEQEISLGQFRLDINTFAEKLSKSPLKRWAINYQNHYLFAVALFAVLQSDKHPILLPNYQAGTLELFKHDFDRMLSEDLPLLNNIRSALALGGKQNGGPPPCAVASRDGGVLTDTTKSRLPELFEQLPELSSEPNITFFTSGSTGEPKKIVRKIKQILEEIKTLEYLFGEQIENAVFYSTVSPQHFYGLLFSLLWPLYTQRLISFPALTSPLNIASTLNSSMPVALVTSPALLTRMPSITVTNSKATIFSSGGRLTTTNLQGCPIIDILGSTETGGVAFRKNITHRWTPFPSVNASQDDSTQCLKISSPFCFHNPFIMGDQVKFYPDGSFDLFDRSDRIVKIEGKRISLAEIENILKQHDSIQEAYAIALESTRQYIGAIIILTPEAQTQPKLLLNALFKKYLAHYFPTTIIPKKFRYINQNQIPMNTQGKLPVAMLKILFDPSLSNKENCVSKTNLNPVSTEYKKYPEIIQKSIESDSHLVLKLFISENIIFFQGHFPNQPILPGVVQLDWAIFYAKQFFNLPTPCKFEVEYVKFTQIISPNTTLFLALTLENNKINFKYFNNKTQYSLGKISV